VTQIQCAGIAVPFYTFMLEKPGLSLGQIIAYPLCSSPGIILSLGHGHFLAHCFRVIIHDHPTSRHHNLQLLTASWLFIPSSFVFLTLMGFRQIHTVTKLPIQWVPGLFPWEVKRTWLQFHLQWVELHRSFTYKPSQHAQGHLYLCIAQYVYTCGWVCSFIQ